MANPKIRFKERGYHGYLIKEPVATRLLRGIIPTNDYDCWLWNGATDIRGRGRIMVDGKLKLASRVAYEVFTGEIPESMNVCHTCDNPLCVNPFHLFLGTQVDNIKDRESKNRGSAKRQPRGWHGRFICQV